MKKTVLIIEDELDLNRFASWVLQAEGYEVIRSMEGDEGLTIARSRHPDLILLDLRLPGRSGWSVLQEIKITPDLASVPVIVFTASADISSKKKARELGASEYLTKPLSAEVLRECVTRVINQHKNNTGLEKKS